MAALSLGVLASTAAELGVSNVAWVLAVEENVLQVLLLQVRPFQDILQIRLSETYPSFSLLYHIMSQSIGLPLSLIKTSEQ